MSGRELELNAALSEASELLDQMGRCLSDVLESLNNESFEDEQTIRLVRGFPPLPEPKEEAKAALSILYEGGGLSEMIERATALRELQSDINARSGAKSRKATDARVQTWQAEAIAKRTKNPSLSAIQIAKKLAEAPSETVGWDTIARNIRPVLK